ncbi:MAG: HDOD domain-containing protein [Rhodocyclaceae bacterium]|nr:HDOD domain-containing protein [Rhodocyclaceae bacterium]
MKVDVDHLLSRADVLPALPQVVHRILQALSDDRADTDTLVGHVACDPAIVARVLAAANASAVGAGHVDSVRQAVLLLGLDRVRGITLATSIIDRFRPASHYDAQHLWLHSVGVAVCSQAVAQHAELDADMAYAAGLLHDIGQLLLFAVVPQQYEVALRLKRERDICIVDAEREVLGIDHALVGGALARHWRLPVPIVDAIAAHHAGETVPETEIGDAVHVGEVLSHGLDLGSSPNDLVPDLSELACARVGINWQEFASHFAEIEARFAVARLVLGL